MYECVDAAIAHGSAHVPSLHVLPLGRDPAGVYPVPVSLHTCGVPLESQLRRPGWHVEHPTPTTQVCVPHCCMSEYPPEPSHVAAVLPMQTICPAAVHAFETDVSLPSLPPVSACPESWNPLGSAEQPRSAKESGGGDCGETHR